LCLVERLISFVSVITRMCGGSPYFPCMMFSGSSLESRRPLTLTEAMRNSSGLICGVWYCSCVELHGIADLLNLGVGLVAVAGGLFVPGRAVGVVSSASFFTFLDCGCALTGKKLSIRGVPSEWRPGGRLRLQQSCWLMVCLPVHEHRLSCVP
jgi:hypothetical protein